MKNDINQHIQQARETTTSKSLYTDILAIPEVIEKNRQRLAQQPRRKRRRDYTKKILNDSFIMNA